MVLWCAFVYALYVFDCKIHINVFFNFTCLCALSCVFCLSVYHRASSVCTHCVNDKWSPCVTALISTVTLEPKHSGSVHTVLRSSIIRSSRFLLFTSLFLASTELSVQSARPCVLIDLNSSFFLGCFVLLHSCHRY